MIFFPQVSFVRLDRDPGRLIQLESIDLGEVDAEVKKQRQENLLSRLREFYGQRPSVEEFKEVVSHMLRNAGNWGYLKDSGGRALDTEEVISFVRKEGKSKIFVLARSGADSDRFVERMRNELLPEQEVALVTDEGKLAELIGAYLCASTSASRAEQSAQLAPVVVIYKPAIGEHEGASEKAVTSREIAKLPEREEQDSQNSMKSQAALEEEIRRIYEALQQGHLRQARQAMDSLRREQPQRTDVRQLQDEIEQKVKGRIAATLLGGASGHHVLDAQAALIALQGGEQSFRLSVEPLEPVYFYLFRIDRSKKIDVLFPRANGNPANLLSPGQTVWLPSPAPEPGYPFHGVTGEVAEIWMVMSRWPARELEQWRTKLTGQEGEDAGRHLVEALKERKEAQVGGCDVRTLQFAGGSSG